MFLTSREADGENDVISERISELAAGCGAVPPAGQERGGADATRPPGRPLLPWVPPCPREEGGGNLPRLGTPSRSRQKSCLVFLLLLIYSFLAQGEKKSKKKTPEAKGRAV